MPFAGSFIVGSLLTPMIVRRVRPMLVVTCGLLVSAVGFIMLTQVGGPHALAILVTSSVTFCVGLSFAFTLTTD
jgi:DHA2 family multidrug resistance protein-like MFS transporter